MRRYTAFAQESIQLLPSSASDFGRKSVFVISRNGDLAGATWVQFDLPQLNGDSNVHYSWTKYLGHVLLQEVTVSIGGSTIDKHITEWYQILYELQLPASKEGAYSWLIGNRSELTANSAQNIPAATIYVPLQFWFNKSHGLSLPLIALQFHETRIEVLVRDFNSCIVKSVAGTVTPHGSLGITLWQDYTYLDVSERSSVAAESQEQIIDLLSFTGVETVTGSTFKTRLAFNHPSKFFAFVIRDQANTAVDSNGLGGNRWCDFSMKTNGSDDYAGTSPLQSGVLLLNGNERFTQRKAEYFSMIQPLQRFTKVTSKGVVYTYSFSLFPETAQPSGTLNCSRIDSLQWSLQFNDTRTFNVFMFSQHINILRIKSGMAGLGKFIDLFDFYLLFHLHYFFLVFSSFLFLIFCFYYYCRQCKNYKLIQKNKFTIHIILLTKCLFNQYINQPISFYAMKHLYTRKPNP